MMKLNQILILGLLLSIATGIGCDFLYRNSAQNTIDVDRFQQQLIEKDAIATKTLNALKEIIIHSSIDSLISYPFAENGISYYAFNKKELVFWSDNNLNVKQLANSLTTNWQYIQLPNAHCIGKAMSFNSISILAVVKIKNNYQYENNDLRNNYSSDFKIDKRVQIINGKSTDKFAVHNAQKEYLFSFDKTNEEIFDEKWALFGLIAYLLSFLLLFILFVRSPSLLNKKYFELKTYSIALLFLGLFFGLCLYFNFPSTLFWNKFFTPVQYASNPLLASINHLTIATGFVFSGVYLFYFRVKLNPQTKIWFRHSLQFLLATYFVFFDDLLGGLIKHSSIQLSILRINDFSFIALWIHLLLLLWGIGFALLFFKSHKSNNPEEFKKIIYFDILLFITTIVICALGWPSDLLRITVSFFALWSILYLPLVLKKFNNIYVLIAFWTFIFTGVIVWSSIEINNNKKKNKYKILAQNISINGNNDNDKMADILLEELDVKINTDAKIKELTSISDSILVANDYINKTYLRGFWNKYEMRLNVALNSSELWNMYDQYIKNSGSKIKNTHFYSLPTNENNISYIGSFPAKANNGDSLFFYMEFYPRRNFKSYSFPNLLITSSPDIQTHLKLAIAKYEGKNLIYSSGNSEFPPTSEWIKFKQNDFFTTIHNNRTYYIYSSNKNSHIVIKELQLNSQIAYWLYYGYTFLGFLATSCLFTWLFFLVGRKKKFRIGLTAKFQYAFIGLLVFSFILIFYVSVNFIQKKYQEEQIANLENKKIYIQKALQDMYYWNQDLNEINTQSLNFALQDLSYIYHTDIHVYDNRGLLKGSSQPIIFNKNLIGDRISPFPFFTNKSNINQYEHIGNLKYLCGYTDFYNGDYLQIGYISIPQFFSQKEIGDEIEDFLAVIIHIYLLIIVLTVLLSLFIGKQLSSPLKMLENKLKEMRLGQRNEKIDYTLNDEIGQLVLQYNRTLDELEQSAKLLAQSERETAWKSMARQVAHEINNPLTPMKLTIQQMQRTKEMKDERFDDYFTKSTVILIEQIDNLSRIAGTFSNFARMPEASFERVDIAAKLTSAVQLFANNYEQVTTNYNGPENGVFVYADPEQLVQVFNNLLKNALQSIPTKRKGIISTNLSIDESEIIIQISDNGNGITTKLQEKIFAPNFTTKSTGMGLGLAISKNIIDISGGSISFKSKVNIGTTFRITLPKAE